MVPPGEGNEARGDGRRGVGVSHSTAEAGALSPRDPVEGRGHRQVAPVEGKTANTPRLGLYCPRVLGQWFDGIRFYAAASSPTRSRRTWAGLR